jgi:hypothetical protein
MIDMSDFWIEFTYDQSNYELVFLQLGILYGEIRLTYCPEFFLIFFAFLLYCLLKFIKSDINSFPTDGYF